MKTISDYLNDLIQFRADMVSAFAEKGVFVSLSDSLLTYPARVLEITGGSQMDDHPTSCLPPGTIVFHHEDTEEIDSLLRCDGRAIPAANYPALYEILTEDEDMLILPALPAWEGMTPYIVSGGFVIPPSGVIIGITIKTQPTMLTYRTGDALDLSGLAVTLLYNDLNTLDVALKSFLTHGITTSPAHGSPLSLEDAAPVEISVGDDPVLIIYTDPLTITERPVAALTSITVTAPPDKLTYNEYELFDLSGLIITLEFDNNEIYGITYTNLSSYGITSSPRHGATLTSYHDETEITFTLTQPCDVFSNYDLTLAISPAILPPVRITPVMNNDNFPPPVFVSFSSSLTLFFSPCTCPWYVFDGYPLLNPSLYPEFTPPPGFLLPPPATLGWWSVQGNSLNNVFGEWLQIDFCAGGNPLTAHGPRADVYRIYPFAEGTVGFPKEFMFKGSSDGSDWTLLDEAVLSSPPQAFVERKIKEPKHFRYYRLFITNIFTNGGSLSNFNNNTGFRQFEILSFEAPSFGNYPGFIGSGNGPDINLERISPVMTSDNAPWPYVATASSSSGLAPYLAFADNSIQYNWGNCGWQSAFSFVPSGNDYANGEEWIQIDLNTPKTVNMFSVCNRRDFPVCQNSGTPTSQYGIPVNFELAGSNDPTFSTFTSLRIVTNREPKAAMDTTTYTFENTVPFRYYRLIVTRVYSSSNYVILGHLGLYRVL